MFSAVAAAVVAHADGVAVRHGVRTDQVLAPQLDAIEAELGRRDIDQPLDHERHLRPAGAAIGLVGMVLVNTAMARSVAAGMA